MLEMLKERKAALEARGKKGFTLMEMLIVIAIIAVLVAIAIPVLSAQLGKARATTDEANIRDGYAAVQVAILDSSATPANGTTYKLQKDGKVVTGTETGAGDYTTQGTSNDLDGKKGNIGGVDATWGPEGTITYTIQNGTVATITCSVNAPSA